MRAALGENKSEYTVLIGQSGCGKTNLIRNMISHALNTFKNDKIILVSQENEYESFLKHMDSNSRFTFVDLDKNIGVGVKAYPGMPIDKHNIDSLFRSISQMIKQNTKDGRKTWVYFDDLEYFIPNIDEDTQVIDLLEETNGLNAAYLFTAHRVNELTWRQLYLLKHASFVLAMQMPATSAEILANENVIPKSYIEPITKLKIGEGYLFSEDEQIFKLANEKYDYSIRSEVTLTPSKQFIHAEQQLNRLLGISFGGGINGF